MHRNDLVFHGVLLGGQWRDTGKRMKRIWNTVATWETESYYIRPMTDGMGKSLIYHTSENCCFLWIGIYSDRFWEVLIDGICWKRKFLSVGNDQYNLFFFKNSTPNILFHWFFRYNFSNYFLNCLFSFVQIISTK